MNSFEKLIAFSAFNTAMLITRLWLGSIMIKHSITYLFKGKMPELINFLTEVGFPAPEAMAYLSQTTELIAGLLILLGIRIGAMILAFTMGIAVLFAHKLLIFSEGELAFNYFMLALIISLLGTGKYGLDHLIQLKIRSGKLNDQTS